MYFIPKYNNYVWINYITRSHIETIKLEEKEAYPFIEGETIDFIAINTDNIGLYAKWINDPKVRIYSRNEMPLTTEEVKKRYFSQEGEKGWREIIAFELWHKQDQKTIGLTGLTSIRWTARWANAFLQIGEVSYWNQNIATEATQMLLKYAFDELDLNRISATIAVHNVGSWRVAEKSGFIFEGILKHEDYVDGEYVDVKSYHYLKEDWMKLEE